MRPCPLTDVQVSKPLYLLGASRGNALPQPLLPLLRALLMRWRLIPQHSPCRSSSRMWWSQHDVGFVASADSSEIGNSVPACTPARSVAGDRHSARQSACARDYSCPHGRSRANEQAENAARGSCGAQKQRVYRGCKRSVTGMPNAGQRIKRNCEGECEGDSAPSSFASSMAASTRSTTAARKSAACATACERRR
jgi:hypothetical protein